MSGKGGIRLTQARIHQLENGLQVVLYPRPHTPLAGFFVWYRVGARNESAGQTGLSHFLEHMCFKDTAEFPWKRYEEALYRRGAQMNAFTSHDATCYFEVLPAEHLELPIAIEARRMGLVQFEPEVAVRERTIIVSEREGQENQPGHWLLEEVQATAFAQHPYGRQVIGSKEDIRAVTAASLQAHYAAYYRPDNAVAVAVGNFDPDRVLAQIQQHFQPLPPGGPAHQSAPPEPPQAGLRRVEQRRPAPVPIGMYLYKVPATPDPDTVPLQVLAALLAGAQGSAGGRSLNLGKSSRLYRALVKGQVAAGVSVGIRASRDPGLLRLHVTGRRDTDLAWVEEVLFQELAAVAAGRFSADELERARQQLQVGHRYRETTVMDAANALGWQCLVQPTVAAGVAAHVGVPERLAAVTADDVQRVAARYLHPEACTVGWLHPAEAAAAQPAPAAAAAPAAQATTDPAPADPAATTPLLAEAPSRQIDRSHGTDPGLALTGIGRRPSPLLAPDRIHQQALPGGARLAVYPRPGTGTVAVRVWLPRAGTMADAPGREGLARLTAACLTRGFAGRTPEELDQAADATGIALSAAIGTEGVLAELRCLAEQLGAGLDLLAGALRRPEFTPAEVERLRQQTLTNLRFIQTNPNAMAEQRLMARLYPPNHPFHRSDYGQEEVIRTLTRDDLVTCHQALYGPAGLIVTVSGDVVPAAVAAELAARVDDWGNGPGPALVLPDPAVPTGGQEYVTIPGKSQSDLAMGVLAVPRTHPDWFALHVLGHVLGGGMMGRLFKGVREILGLSYYQRVDFQATLAAPAPWSLRMGCATANVPLALAALNLELERLTAEPVAAAELGAVQDALQARLAVALETPEQVAGWLLDMQRYALGPDYLQQYPVMLAALTPERLQQTAARYLDPAGIVTVVAGPAPGGAT